MMRLTKLATLTIALLALAACDQKKSAPAQSAPQAAPQAAPAAVVAPDPNRPPTDDEVLSALLGFWRDRGAPGQMFQPGEYFRLVTPIGAAQGDNVITQTVMGTRIRTVTVTYTFRANADLTYMCIGAMGKVIDAISAPSGPEFTLPNPASAGSAFSCAETVEAERVEEGWNLRPVSGDMISYLFKR